MKQPSISFCPREAAVWHFHLGFQLMDGGIISRKSRGRDRGEWKPHESISYASAKNAISARRFTESEVSFVGWPRVSGSLRRKESNSYCALLLMGIDSEVVILLFSPFYYRFTSILLCRLEGPY